MHKNKSCGFRLKFFLFQFPKFMPINKETLKKLKSEELENEEHNKYFRKDNYLEEKDFLKRPLSKLTYDIAQELGLL